MTLRFNQLVTHFEPDEALTVIEFLDQLREVLINTYGEQIEHMLKEENHLDATTPPPPSKPSS